MQVILPEKFIDLSQILQFRDDTPGETANSVQQSQEGCELQKTGNLCEEKTCFSCNSIREANSQTVRGTLLVR